MRKKNIKKAAEALFASQGDDKNKLLATFIEDNEARKLVKNQGRALLILERLCLKEGKFSFTEDEIYDSLLRKLEKKGHRIQEDDEEDTEEFAQEKSQAKTERLAMVDNVLGKTLDELPEEEEKPEDAPVHKDEFDQVMGDYPGNYYGAPGAPNPSPEIVNNGVVFDQEDVDAWHKAEGYEKKIEEVNTEVEYDLPEVVWQLIGQAYIDGIRTGQNSRG